MTFWLFDKNTQVIIGEEVEVRYDDNVWYKGKLIEYNEDTDEWIAQFYSDGEISR